MALRDTRHGRMLYLKGDRFVGRSLELYGEYSEFECELFAKLVPQGGVVVEVGANIGTHTVPLARMVGPQGAVLAFEPQRVIHQILCANVAMNGLFNVHTHHAAVGRERGRILVPPVNYMAEGNFGGVAMGATQGEEVPVVPLDDFALSSLNLLKVDVEGMEAEVLRGAGRLIARHRPPMYVENDRKEKSPALIGLILELGYQAWWHFPPLFNPANFDKRGENVFGNIVSGNLLCMPQEANVNVQGLRPVKEPDDWW